ncbi:MAG: hypothetical protein FJ040_06590 [Chloroflexi bacterium]|nr:hypothetical protein [Chloroflexota bacterium]
MENRNERVYGAPVRLLIALLCLLALIMPAWASSVSAAKSTVRRSVTIRATLARHTSISATDFSKFTFVMLNKYGRVLATHKLSAGAKVNKTSSLITLVNNKFPAGISFHLIDGGGDYFGPVVINWNAATRVTSNRLSTTLKELTTAQAVINLGTVTVAKLKPTVNQGYGYTTAKIVTAATPTVEADITRGIPEGVGNGGRSGGNTRSATMRATAGEMYDGMDADDDGILNAFDINDDGDTTLDHQDTTTATAPTTGANCEAQASFTLFQNYKATDPNFSGTINQYGTGQAEIKNAAQIEAALDNTVSFAIQRISQVCGENVTKMEFKGVNVPYAPAEYVSLPTTGFDVQWQVGARTFNNAAINWTAVPAATYPANPFTCNNAGCNISALDVFMQRVTTVSGKVYEFTTTPSFVFMAHPMLTSIAVVDSADACASATYTTVDYTNLISSPALGSMNNKIQVTETDINNPTKKLCIKTHRPQRPEYVGENTGADTSIYNIGKLNYAPDIPNGFGGSGSGGGLCDAMRTSDSANDTLAVKGGAVETPVLMEWSISALKTCFANRGATWTSGTLAIDIQVTAPVNNSGNSAQKIYLNIIQAP